MAADPLIAHFVRRLTFGPRPGQVERLAWLGADGALDELLRARPATPPQPRFGTENDYNGILKWYLDLLRGEGADLHERMVFFWHGHLTSGLSKVEPVMLHRQMLLFREHALGNFRTFLKQVTVDAGMLLWLDGNGSRASSPNENYARELMELFALGRGNYTEADVRAGAYALAGWFIDYDDDHRVKFDFNSAPRRAVTFLGRPGIQTADQVVDAVCDHPACAPWIASRLFAYLVGRPSTSEETARLAEVFRRADLEIAPLVEAIVRDPAFSTPPTPAAMRSKTPLEWFLAAERFLGVELNDWYLDALGQRPLNPPNVAGWGSELMLSASAALTRAQIAFDASSTRLQPVEGADIVTSLADTAALPPLSAETAAALDAALSTLDSAGERAAVARAVLACSPEFCLH